MRRSALLLSVLVATGCTEVQPGVSTTPARSGGPVELYSAAIRVSLRLPRSVQLLPDFWDKAQFKLESPKLRSPQSRSVNTATSSVQVEFLAPPGPATLSVELRTGNLVVATGQGTASLMPGTNVLAIQLTTQDEDLVMTLAGNGSSGRTDGVGAAARFNEPNGLALDGAGNLYVADYMNHAIRKVTPDGVVTTVAGNGTPGNNGLLVAKGADVRFTYPQDVAYDAAINSLYVADASNHAIRKIDLTTGEVSTPAGSPSVAGFSDGTGDAAKFYNPTGLALADNGDLYIADMTNNRIRRMTRSGVVTTFAGSASSGNSDGTVLTATFNGPQKIAFDGLGDLFVADIFSRRIRKIAAGTTVTTLAGSSMGYADGLGTQAQFNSFGGLAFDGLGTLLVGDSGNNTLRTVSTAGLVGSMFGVTAGYTDGSPANARFYYPGGIAVKGDRLYISDTKNHCIRLFHRPPSL